MDDRWLMMRLRPYRTVEDRIEGIVLSFVDITQRRHAEDALRHSDERYRSMLGGILRRLLDRQPAVRPDGYLKIKVPAQHAYCSATKAGCK